MTKNYRYLEKKPSIILYEHPKELEIPEIVIDDNLENKSNYILANEQNCTADLGVSKIEEDEDKDDKRLSKPLAVYIHGPFGAPASHIFRAQHAVLIGAGIGITPFASILQERRTL